MPVLDVATAGTGRLQRESRFTAYKRPYYNLGGETLLQLGGEKKSTVPE